jgi:hypothetical protein
VGTGCLPPSNAQLTGLQLSMLRVSMATAFIFNNSVRISFAAYLEKYI